MAVMRSKHTGKSLRTPLPVGDWKMEKIKKLRVKNRQLQVEVERLKEETDNIEGHIEMLIDKDILEKIGADIGDNRPLQLRVLRILDDYNNYLQKGG